MEKEKRKKKESMPPEVQSKRKEKKRDSTEEACNSFTFDSYFFSTIPGKIRADFGLSTSF